MLPTIILARVAPAVAQLVVGQAAAAEAAQVVAADVATQAEAARPALDLAAALRQRFAEGWHIRDVAYGAELAITVVRGHRAERHTVEFDGHGGITGHSVAAVRAPAEPRVYAAEQQLAMALATESAPLHVYEECGVPVMYFDEWAIGLDADDYWVVERAARGGAARRLVAAALAGAIVRDVSESDGASIDYHVDDGGASYRLHVERDAADRIVSAELRQTPERDWDATTNRMAARSSAPAPSSRSSTAAASWSSPAARGSRSMPSSPRIPTRKRKAAAAEIQRALSKGFRPKTRSGSVREPATVPVAGSIDQGG